jgi:hypothetical protein
MALTVPDFLTTPFAESGARNVIPVTATGTNKASFDTGFPPITMIPISSGGIPPEGKDFNGVLWDITMHTVWQNAGGQYKFDATFAAAIGGYSIGMILQNNAGTASYISAIDNNTTDFNTTPASIGTLWIPNGGNGYSSISVATTGGVTVLTALQASASFITITGTLVSNATITVPAALGDWVLINSTTGAYTVTVIALGGAGVPVLQGFSDRLMCDGVDVLYEASTAITKSPGDNSNAIATTEFVEARVVATVTPTILLFYANF